MTSDKVVIFYSPNFKRTEYLIINKGVIVNNIKIIEVNITQEQLNRNPHNLKSFGDESMISYLIIW